MPLTLRQIEEGLYIDFEGFGSNNYDRHPPPVLCGCRFGGEEPVQYTVFTKSFRWAAETDESGKVTYCKERKDYLRDLLDVQTRGGRKIFFFSQHEKEQFDQILGIRIRRRLIDLHKLLKKRFPAVVRPRTLIRYCKAAGIEVPKGYGKGKVTEKLRLVRNFSGSRKQWDSLKKEHKARRAWELLIAHNSFDVSCMYDLAKVVLV
jgi:hypothetical protein